ncbi:CPBP family intramembrane glutamic endopeptidase [Bradyrhizobium sp. CCBAU 11361]|uniref:CPBP family intramembrane glutamic endopeptidase n=1 Tax=Bradyrhizobium sp. CCBAU 11361 TaxID=1630812 RepID=UPI0023028B40|nr:CPBP family intramembrane glutamic endopeptidase [Bradyrhizobium sp. CCBAU 11361]
MQAPAETTPPPVGLVASTSMFAVFSILLWLTTEAVIPRLRDAFGISPIIGWYVSGSTFVLVPVLVFGCLMAWREIPKRDLGSLRRRLRLNAMNRGDVIWAIGGLFAIATTTAAILALARYLDPSFHPSPWFLLQPPGWHAWVFAAWLPLFVSNILGEELCWRGYLLPRQEAGFGPMAWLPNGILWCLFHWSFGWPIVVTLLPLTLLLPWIVQRRQNTSVGIVIHGAFNAAGFIAVTSGASS